MMYLFKITLKPGSRPSVSNVMSADVKLATTLMRRQYCDISGQCHKFHLKKHDGIAY